MLLLPIEWWNLSFVNGYALIVLDNKTGLINKQNRNYSTSIYDAIIIVIWIFGAIIPNYIFLKKITNGVYWIKGEVAVDFKYNSKKIFFELFE
jgi:hypothetical protein